MEGCLAKEWKEHAFNFLTRKKSPRRWTALLVKKLWLVTFDMWYHRCKVLHKNYLSNKVHDLDNIDRSILSLLRINTIELLPHEQLLFYVTKSSILVQTRKLRREWGNKASTVYQTYLRRLKNPINHKTQQLAMKR